MSLAFFSAYLLYRGLTGYCLLYARANINTNSGRTTPDESNHEFDPLRDMAVATSTPPLEDNDDPANGRVEQASWESFPASDPPGF